MSGKVERSTSTYYNTNYQYSFVTQNKDGGNDGRKMHGSRRVIIFCLLTTVIPTILIIIPLYLRNNKYADVMYKVSDADVIQIHKGQSSIFCQKHSLRMNSSFSAFQMKGMPELSEERRHIRLKKSMTLPDDTLEYWGFYLFKGATVELRGCSRYFGSKVLVVKGDKILDTCNILDGNEYYKDPTMVENGGHVSVTLETPKEKKQSKATTQNNHSNELIKKHDSFEYNDNKTNHRQIRDVRNPSIHKPNTVLDAGVNHGGNAFNDSIFNSTHDESVSSFENNLYKCYDGNIITQEPFPYAIECKSTNYLEKTTTLKVRHDVLVDGYYYYIFYSDNDFVKNDIHVFFDIYKPTFQYSNVSDSKSCINKTECEFNVGIFSDELVIVEFPTRNGFKNIEDDSSILVSVCQPRVTVYIIFPVAVLLLILLFAFL